MQVAAVYGQSDDAPLANLAAVQHGVVATWQLLALGYSYHAISRRVANGRLHRLYRGVYAVGHTRLSVKGRWMAAVLACGPDALLSHHAAAGLHDLQRPPGGRLDVTCASRHEVAGVRCHVVRVLHPDDRAQIDGIPVTNLARTLGDLAGVVSEQRLRSMLEEVERRGLLDGRLLEAQLQRGNGRRGVAALRRALRAVCGQPRWTQSGLERAFLELIREAQLPEPQTNVIVDGELVDAFWPEHNLIVEVDGWPYHRTKRSFEDDRRRDTKHTLAGRRSIRITGTRIEDEPHTVQRDLSVLLERGRGRSDR
jgi:very-short-patch-repair endonuclease